MKKLLMLLLLAVFSGSFVCAAVDEGGGSGTKWGIKGAVGVSNFRKIDFENDSDTSKRIRNGVVTELEVLIPGWEHGRFSVGFNNYTAHRSGRFDFGNGEENFKLNMPMFLGSIRYTAIAKIIPSVFNFNLGVGGYWGYMYNAKVRRPDSTTINISNKPRTGIAPSAGLEFFIIPQLSIVADAAYMFTRTEDIDFASLPNTSRIPVDYSGLTLKGGLAVYF